MAKSKAKLWLVRESKKEGGWYWVYLGAKPRKPRGGWEPLEADVGLCASSFERVTPKWLHLRYGGGPVEIKFVKPKEPT